MTGEVINRPLTSRLLAPTASGATTATFEVRTAPVVLAVTGAALGSGETVTVRRIDGEGSTINYVPVLLGAMVIDGSASPPESTVTIYDTGTYDAVKTATANDCGLELQAREYC